MKANRYIVDGKRIAAKYQDLGHGAGDLLWWIDNGGIIQWKVFDGGSHHDISRLDMDLRWRGRLDTSGKATLLPPVALYAKYNAEKMPLPVGAMITLEHLGAVRFYLDTKTGLRRLKKRGEDRRKR